MEKFTHIEQFRHLIERVQYANDNVLNNFDRICQMDFTGTVKLHGTNAAICRKNSIISYQSRNSILTIENDHYNFAKTINEIPESQLNSLFDLISTNVNDKIIIYGEFIGKGIQSNVAISQLDHRQFVIFAIKINNKYKKLTLNIKLPEYKIYNILQAEQFHVTIDFEDLKSSQLQLEKFVTYVENECPWAKLFNISGTGEGIVWTADFDSSNSSYYFKTKGTKHKISKTKKQIIEIEPEIQKSIDDFILYAVSKPRLLQGIEFFKEQHIDINIKNIGQFLKWILIDIKKEELDVVKASNLEWKVLNKYITIEAKKFYFQYIGVNYH